MTSPKSVARIAGLLYLILAGCAMFAELYVRGRLVAPGDATATADHIRTSATLFRVGLVVDLVGDTAFLLTVMALYLLLRHVNELVAGAMVAFVAVSVAIGCANLLNQYAALTIATSAADARTFGRPGADALTLLYTDVQHTGGVVNSIFFGLWLLPLGWLVIRSGYFPRFFGVALIAACLGFLVLFFVHFLAPGLGTGVGAVVDALDGIAELGFVAWLLAVGVRVRGPVGEPVRVVSPSAPRS